MSADRDQQLAEALDYLRMPEVTKGKYAVVPVKGDREAVAVIEAAIAEMRAENERLRQALGCHIQADAYRETFPDSDEDAAGLRKSETWWRLMARCAVSLDSELADACGSSAHEIPEVLAGIESAVAAARAGLRQKGGSSAA